MLLVTYAVWASRVEHPAVDLGLVRSVRSAIGLTVVILAAVVLGAVLFMIPVYVQAIQGFSAFHAGLVLLPQDLVMASGFVLGNRLARRGLARESAIGGALLLTGTTALLLMTGVDSPAWQVALILAGRGLALALIVQPVLDALMMAIPMSKLADANTLFNVVQRAAASFAIALLITLLEQRQRVHLADGDSIQGAMMAGWLDVIVALVALSVAAVVVALLFRPGRAAARLASVPASTESQPDTDRLELPELVA